METNKEEVNISTEEKFKAAARVVFTRKGYAATKTRDIAEEAGLNLALLNYYFRSKEKLFEIVMSENLQKLFAFLLPIINDPETTLEEKIEKATVSYIDMLMQNPDLPIFVLSEIRSNPKSFAKNVQLDTKVLNSYLIKQLAEKKKDVNPLQFLISFMGMIIFPFVSKPVFETSEVYKAESFAKLIEERKKLIPHWLKLMLE